MSEVRDSGSETPEEPPAPPETGATDDPVDDDVSSDSSEPAGDSGATDDPVDDDEPAEPAAEVPDDEPDDPVDDDPVDEAPAEPVAEDYDDPVDDDELAVDDVPAEPAAEDYDDPVDDDPEPVAAEETEPPEDEQAEPLAAEDEQSEPAAEDQAEDDRAEADDAAADDEADQAAAEDERAEDERAEADSRADADDAAAQDQADDDADRADAEQTENDRAEADKSEEDDHSEADSTAAEDHETNAEDQTSDETSPADDRTETQDDTRPPDEQPTDAAAEDPDNTERELELRPRDPRWDGSWSQPMQQVVRDQASPSVIRAMATDKQHLSLGAHRVEATSGNAAVASVDGAGTSTGSTQPTVEIGRGSSSFEMSQSADTTQPSPEQPGTGVENPVQPTDDVPPVNPGEEVSEELHQDNPDVATPDPTNQVVEASASDSSGSPADGGSDSGDSGDDGDGDDTGDEDNDGDGDDTGEDEYDRRKTKDGVLSKLHEQTIDKVLGAFPDLGGVGSAFGPAIAEAYKHREEGKIYLEEKGKELWRKIGGGGGGGGDDGSDDGDDNGTADETPPEDDRTETQDGNRPPDEQPIDPAPEDPDNTERELELRPSDPRWDGNWSQQVQQVQEVARDQPSLSAIRVAATDEQGLSLGAQQVEATSGHAVVASVEGTGTAAGSEQPAVEIGPDSSPREIPQPPDTTQPSPEQPGTGVENPAQSVDDIPPINPGEAISEELYRDNPDVTTPDTTNQLVEASASYTSDPPTGGGSESSSGSVERSTGDTERSGGSAETGGDGATQPLDERTGDAKEKSGEQGEDTVGDKVGNLEYRAKKEGEESKDDKTLKETAVEVIAKGLQERLAPLWEVTRELNDSGALGSVVDAGVTFYKEGLEGAKIIADGWVDGLKKGLADKDSSPESEDFKQRAAEMYDRVGRDEEDFKQRNADMYDQVERQGEEVEDTAGGNVENQTPPAEPGEKTTPPAQPRD